MKRIVEMARELGFEYFGYYDYDEEDEIAEDVLFGAYGSNNLIRIVGVAKTV